MGIGTDGPQATSYNLDTNTNDATSLDVSTSVRTDGAGYYIGHEENHPAKQGGAHFSYDYANNKIYLSGIKQGKWLIREVLDGEGDGPPLAFSIRAWRFESVGSKLVCLPRYVHCTIPAAARRGTRLGTELGATHLRPRHEYRTI